MPLGYAMLRVNWRVHRQLSVIAATLPCADDLGETGRVAALEWCVEQALERLRGEGRLSEADEAYIEQEDPPDST